jgi:tripartite-type tricarboxylate transporter receptor subunit TctC
VPEFVLGAFLKTEKLDVTKVPYRDVVQAGRDLGESRIHFLLSSYAVVRPLIEADKVRVLAAGGRKRATVTPSVPAVMETGYPGLLTETTSGLYGPKGMPQGLRERLAVDVIAAANDPVAVQRIVASGQDMNTGGPAELAATLKQQANTVAAVAKVLGMERKQ